jgi:hypothetical protein
VDELDELEDEEDCWAIAGPTSPVNRSAAQATRADAERYEGRRENTV